MDQDVGHFVLVPFFAQGHLIPMVDLGIVIAQRGNNQVSIIITPFNLTRLQTTVDFINRSGLPIDFIPLRFPTEELGLPKGCESVDVLPTENLLLNFHQFYKGHAMLAEQLEAYIRQRQQNNPSIPTIIITDFMNSWTRRISDKLNISRFGFCIVSCFTWHLREIFQQYDHNSDSDLVVPDVDHRIKLILPKGFVLGSSQDQEYIRSDIKDLENSVDGILVNTFYELEPIFVEKYRKMIGKNVWPIGPLSLCHDSNMDKAIRGARSLLEENKILKFLDSMDPASVVFFGVGSLVILSMIQIKEIGKGLEESGCPFIWVIKCFNDDMRNGVEEWLRKDGLEERTKTRSVIIRGWAPQLMIISHASIGALFTHCGGNSTLEGITAGIPMIAWPFKEDQFLNMTFITQIAKTAIGIDIDEEPVYSPNYTVKSDTITKAIERVMNGGEEGEERRKRALDLKDAAKATFDVAGSSHTNMSLFLRQIFNKV
ncbi:Flavonoid glucosyltransferase, family GT1 [Zostera marina]|uniref:Glycosyltransferase n=1 Tax=Zostera marina TaxID=29655 RepID=A0A0K9PY27_ZOSMR|nr:Flavonoid glucosyltransferase, family GT1 [Zostera marina]